MSPENRADNSMRVSQNAATLGAEGRQFKSDPRNQFKQVIKGLLAPEQPFSFFCREFRCTACVDALRRFLYDDFAGG